ncbi:MAG: helix-turn-helix transcriptional regulator [Geminicoccaceae bacterium]
MGAEQVMDRRIGERIRQRRLELGLTLQQLGDTLGCTYQQLQKFESGANRIGASQLHLLARRLEVPIGWFFGEDGAMQIAAASLEHHPGRQRATLEVARSMALIGDAEVRSALAALARAIAGGRDDDDDPASP